MKDKIINYLKNNSEVEMKFNYYSKGWVIFKGISIDNEILKLIVGNPDFDIYPNESFTLGWFGLEYDIKFISFYTWTLLINKVEIEVFFKE